MPASRPLLINTVLSLRRHLRLLSLRGFLAEAISMLTLRMLTPAGAPWVSLAEAARSQ